MEASDVIFLRDFFLTYKFSLCSLSSCRPFVEYKGTIPQTDLQNKLEELEREANALISRGGKVSSASSFTS